MDQKKTHQVCTDAQIGVMHKREQPCVSQKHIQAHGEQAVDQNLVDEADIEPVIDQKGKEDETHHHDPEDQKLQCLGAVAFFRDCKRMLFHIIQIFLHREDPAV